MPCEGLSLNYEKRNFRKHQIRILKIRQTYISECLSVSVHIIIFAFSPCDARNQTGGFAQHQSSCLEGKQSHVYLASALKVKQSPVYLAFELKVKQSPIYRTSGLEGEHSSIY